MPGPEMPGPHGAGKEGTRQQVGDSRTAGHASSALAWPSTARTCVGPSGVSGPSAGGVLCVLLCSSRCTSTSFSFRKDPGQLFRTFRWFLANVALCCVSRGAQSLMHNGLLLATAARFNFVMRSW